VVVPLSFSCAKKDSEDKTKTVQTTVEEKREAQKESKVSEIKYYNKDD
jgi:hypothetical protein